MSNLPMELPKCSVEGHGQMELRDMTRATYEQKFCGTWYDCTYPGCNNSVLYPSKELKELLEEVV